MGRCREREVWGSVWGGDEGGEGEEIEFWGWKLIFFEGILLEGN